MDRYKNGRQRTGINRYSSRAMTAAIRNNANITRERSKMPIYTSACTCGERFEYFSSVADRNKTPKHCGKKSKRILEAAMVAPMFQEYRAVGIPGQPWIKTKQAHKDTLRQHGKVEVGNDSSIAAPKMSDAEFAYIKEQEVKEIVKDRDEMTKIMKEVGIKRQDIAI